MSILDDQIRVILVSSGSLKYYIFIGIFHRYKLQIDDDDVWIRDSIRVTCRNNNRYFKNFLVECDQYLKTK